MPELLDLISTLGATYKFWSAAITAKPPTFDDSLASDSQSETRRFVLRKLEEDVKNLVARTSRVTVVMTEGGETARVEFVGRRRSLKVF